VLAHQYSRVDPHQDRKAATERIDQGQGPRTARRLSVKNDPDAIIVQVSPKVEEAAVPTGPTAEQAEPEVIGRAKEDAAEEAE